MPDRLRLGPGLAEPRPVFPGQSNATARPLSPHWAKVRRCRGFLRSTRASCWATDGSRPELRVGVIDVGWNTPVG